jgi:hypothetical protein
VSLVFKKPIVVERRSTDIGTDRRPQAAWSTPETVLGAIRHRLDNRVEDAGVVVQQEQLVYFPGDFDLPAGSRVTFDGFTWEVVGDPFRAYSHRKNAVHHIEVRVRVGAR